MVNAALKAEIEEAKMLHAEEERIASEFLHCRLRNMGVTCSVVCLVAFGIPFTLRKGTYGPLMGTFLVGTLLDYSIAHFYHCGEERKQVVAFHQRLTDSKKFPLPWEGRAAFKPRPAEIRRLQEQAVEDLGLDPAHMEDDRQNRSRPK